jgi:hypothetical protein
MIVSERGEKGKVLLAKRVGDRFSFDLSAMRAAIGSLFPLRQSYSHLETCPRNAKFLTVYLSLSKEGIGRVQDKFYEWAVDGTD